MIRKKKATTTMILAGFFGLAQLSEETDKMRAEGNHLLFTHLTGGNHRATWFVAYGIEGVQDWLFEQHQ